MSDELVDWLLESDPAIRWKVLSDLLGASESAVAQERSQVALRGWGARVLAAQDADGRWGGGDYTPKWISTTYTLLFLHWLGLPSAHPAALRGCERQWEWASRWRSTETCILGLLILNTSAHRYPVEQLDQFVGDLLDLQLHDGGWNCAAGRDRTRHGSFNTSIIALEALRAYEVAGGTVPTGTAQAAGREFFLQHRLYRSHRTGDVAIRGSTRFPALPQWHFDVLRGLEHFATVGAPRDERLSDAIGVVEQARRSDGRWPTYAAYPGRSWFELEPRGPSRWNTARALRVLQWWGGADACAASGCMRSPQDAIRRHGPGRRAPTI